MAKSKQSIVLTRREALLLSTTAGLGAALGKPPFGSDSVKTGAHQEPGNVSTPPTAVAKTQYGKVRGFVDGGVLTFKGAGLGESPPEYLGFFDASEIGGSAYEDSANVGMTST